MITVFKPYGLNVNLLWWIVGSIVIMMAGITLHIGKDAVRGSRLEYHISKEGIHIVWGKPITIPWNEIEDLRWNTSTGSLSRTVGTSVPGLHVGRFYLRGEGNLRLYAGKINGHLIVIQKVDGQRIGITPDDPERFLAAAKRYLPSLKG